MHQKKNRYFRFISKIFRGFSLRCCKHRAAFSFPILHFRDTKEIHHLNNGFYDTDATGSKAGQRNTK